MCWSVEQDEKRRERLFLNTILDKIVNINSCLNMNIKFEDEMKLLLLIT